MAKYYGAIGYSLTKEEPANSGIWVEKIEERFYYGDVLRNRRQNKQGDKINDDISISNEISIIADEYAYQNFFAIKYVTWMGTKWKVTDVEIQRPRLTLSIGGGYNGPSTGTSSSV